MRHNEHTRSTAEFSPPMNGSQGGLKEKQVARMQQSHSSRITKVLLENAHSCRITVQICLLTHFPHEQCASSHSLPQLTLQNPHYHVQGTDTSLRIASFLLRMTAVFEALLWQRLSYTSQVTYQSASWHQSPKHPALALLSWNRDCYQGLPSGKKRNDLFR